MDSTSSAYGQFSSGSRAQDRWRATPSWGAGLVCKHCRRLEARPRARCRPEFFSSKTPAGAALAPDTQGRVPSSPPCSLHSRGHPGSLHLSPPWAGKKRPSGPGGWSTRPMCWFRVWKILEICSMTGPVSGRSSTECCSAGSQACLQMLWGHAELLEDCVPHAQQAAVGALLPAASRWADREPPSDPRPQVSSADTQGGVVTVGGVGRHAHIPWHRDSGKQHGNSY